MPDHWQIGCSNASRWVNCPGSKYAVDESEAGFMAEIGTLGHKIVEHILQCWLAFNAVKPDVSSILTDEDKELLKELDPTQLDWFKAAIRTCVDGVKPLAEGADEVRLEVKRKSSYVPDHGGTADVVIWFKRLKLLIVIDFKFGSVAVDCEDNEQIMCYLNLAREDYPKATKYLGVVIQPANNGVDAQKFSTRQLNAFRVRQVAAADPTNMDRHGDPSWCEYCPLLAVCDSAAKMTVSAVEEFGSVATIINKVPDAPTASDVERLERVILMHKLAVKAYDKATAVLKQWHSEHDIDLNYHRLSSSNYRSWRPSALPQLEQLYGSDVVKKSLVTPPELQKLLNMKKKEFDETFNHMIDLTSRPTLKAGVKPTAGELASDLPIYNDGKSI